MQNVAQNFDSVNVAAILGRFGFRVKGTRADCPFCEGHSRLTVAIRGELYFCHRCHRGGTVRQLARRQGIKLPPPRLRLADIPKNQFRQWLAEKMTALSKQEWRLHCRVRWARVCLKYFPEHEAAWTLLAELYHMERQFEMFWQSVSDRVGRYGLYRAWRKYAR